MRKFDISSEIVNLVKMTLRKTMNKFQIGGTLSDSFETTSGIRQGNSLSTLLFNFTLEKIVQNRTVNPRGTVYNGTRQYITYADDVIIGRSTQ
jgi:hypothetical protein